VWGVGRRVRVWAPACSGGSTSASGMADGFLDVSDRPAGLPDSVDTPIDCSRKLPSAHLTADTAQARKCPRDRAMAR